MMSFSTLSSAETEAEYKQRLQALSESIKTLQAELKTAKASKNKLQQSLQASEESIATHTKKVAKIKEALAREKKQLNQLQAQRAELVKNKKAQQQHIIAAIRHTYQLGQQSQLKLLLNQENPERMSRMLKYHDYIVSAHQQKITVYSQTIDSLNTLESRIKETQQQLKQRHKALSQRQHTLKTSQQTRKRALKQLSSSLRKKGTQLSTLTSDRDRLQDLLDKATNALANLSLPSGTEAFAKAKGKLPLPTQGNITHAFGSPQFDGQLKRNGIYIRNQPGADVISVHHGRVIFSAYFRSHGLLLIVDHGDGYMSLYGHNETLLKDTGDWVSTGETIATVGNSGGQQTTGLYFEIRHQGQPQNPQPWLRRR
jgi:septal ring factor EnvC (AmiA/AmiB activator)